MVRWRSIWSMLLAVQAVQSTAQGPVPFVSDLERTMLFVEGRFLEVDARPARTMHVLNDGLLFTDHAERLCLFSYEAHNVQVLEPRPLDQLQVSGDRAAWIMGDSLFTLRGGRAHLLARGVQRFQLSDSLIVLQDSAEHELAVIWRGRRSPLATVEHGSETPQWAQGVNTVSFYDRSRRTLSIFERGELRTLATDTDPGAVVPGNGIVGFWDGARDEFVGDAGRGPVKLSGMRPINAQAGDGIVAFVDGTLKLKAWRGGEVHTLTDSMPAQYEVRDQVLVYPWAGRLMLLGEAGPVEVEPYIPEQWEVSGDLLVYLDLNRTIRGIRTNGERVRFGNESGVDGFRLFGTTVIYRSPSGPFTIADERRSYRF